MPVCAKCGQENPEGAQFCNACGAALAEAPPTGEVRKTVTVVFTDVTGSTAMGERLDPESLRRVMGRYFDAMSAVLERHGGTVEKYIGDAIMAVFGVPVLHEDDALRAVRAAAEMRERLAEVNEGLERDHGVRIEARTGVNTGEVVTGDAAGQRLATGDAVNVAARLEQAAQPGEILIGEATRQLVRDAVQVEPAQLLDLKGKSEPVAAFRLLNVLEGAPAYARRLDSPMVGRERELSLLRQAFDRAVDERACHLFTVLGPAGVGKSRLVHELLASVQGEARSVRPLPRLRRRDHLLAARRDLPPGGRRGRARGRTRGGIGRGDVLGRPQALREARSRAAARADPRRRPLGGTHLPRPDRPRRRLGPRCADPPRLSRASRAA